MTDVQPEEVLEDIRGLRQRTRRERHAYWFPLVLFGGILLVVVIPLGTVIRAALNWHWAGHVVMLVGTIAGALLTRMWYQRKATRTGLRTAVNAPAWTWVAGGAAFFFLTTMGFLAIVQVIWGPLWGGDSGGLLAIALGLALLAIAERSALLWGITIVYWSFAIMDSLANVPVLGWWPQWVHYEVFQGANGGISFMGDGETLQTYFLSGVVLLLGGTISLMATRLGRSKE